MKINLLLKKRIKNFLPTVFFAVALMTFFVFGFHHLTKFETADEHYWIYSNTTNNNYWNHDNGRIQQYWYAIMNQNWAQTRINDKPGVMLAYVSGIGEWLRGRLELNIASGKITTPTKIEKAERINLYFRLPQLIFNGLFMILLFWLIRKLVDNGWIALFAATLMLLSPILVGVSQIINPDSLLWEFSFASIISFLIYLQNPLKRKYAIISSLFLGFSLLTKYTSIILFPFFLFLLLVKYIIDEKNKNDVVRVKIGYQIITYLMIILGSLAIYAVLLPDNLINFQHFLKGSIGFKGLVSYFIGLFILCFLIISDSYFNTGRVCQYLAKKVSKFSLIATIVLSIAIVAIFLVIILNAYIGGDYLKLFTLEFDSSAKRYFANGYNWRLLLRQFQPFVFSLTPVVIFLAFFAWVKNSFLNGKYKWIVFSLTSFIPVYIIAVTIQHVPSTVRYSIMLYPIIYALAGIGIWQIFESKKRLIFSSILFSVLFLISIYSLYSAKPFYFNYTNSFLPDKYVVSDAWGYGGYEAAQYLNSIPGSEAARIWSDYNGVCLFFNGSCSANKITMQGIIKKNEKRGTRPNFSYFVSQRRGHNLSSSLWDDLEDNFGSQEIWNLIINDRKENYIKVYSNKL